MFSYKKLNKVIRLSNNPYSKKHDLFPYLLIYLPTRVRKTGLGESLAKSLVETLGQIFGETFRAKESRQASRRESWIGLYARLLARLCPRLVFLRGYLLTELLILKIHFTSPTVFGVR